MVTKLSCNRSKNTCALWVFIVSDDDGCILVKTNICAVVAAYAAGSTNNYCLYNLALLYDAAGCCFLNRSNNNVADVGVSSAGTTENSDTSDLLRSGVVGNLEVTFLLYHSVCLLTPAPIIWLSR